MCLPRANFQGLRTAPERGWGGVQGARTPQFLPSQLALTSLPGFPPSIGGPPFSRPRFLQSRDVSRAMDVDPGLGASPLRKGGFQASKG